MDGNVWLEEDGYKKESSYFKHLDKKSLDKIFYVGQNFRHKAKISSILSDQFFSNKVLMRNIDI